LCRSGKDLFDDGVSLTESREITLIINVSAVVTPRPIGARRPEWSVREESEVTVRHVVVVGAQQNPRHGRLVRETVDDHCHIQRIAFCTVDSYALGLRSFEMKYITPIA